FNNVGTDLNRYWRSTAYTVGKFDLTSQVNNIHQVKGGFEFRTHELKLDSYTLRAKIDPNSGAQIVPFQPYVPEPWSAYREKYTRTPKEFSAYLQDKLELKEIIINAGLRFDYFDPNHVKIADPSDPSIYTPLKPEHKWKNPTAPKEERIEYTPDERRAFMHKKVDPKMQLSPRLGIAYPITDKGVIHFSYGHFFQIPEFQYLYSNPDFKITEGGGYFLMGNADLNPQRTVMYEIGLQQQLTTDIGIDVTLFYRDVRDWVGTSPLIQTPMPSIQYAQYENKDYANVRGVTLKFEKRYSHGFSARVDYSFQVAEGTYSNPTDAFNAIQAKEEPRLNLIPLNWDQNHTLNGSLIWDYRGYTFSLIGRYWTGRPYTPSFPVGSVVGGAALIGLKENSERLPNQKSVDLYINRKFMMSNRVGLNVFLNIYNLFDIRDEVAVYSDTGSADYTTTVRPWAITYNPRRVGTVDDYVKQPGWYTAPREIQLGFSLEF
ncbi:MAG: TonB-dependent receptor, partial [candidate division KSB1 bacterium]|nr:TonB-dependent receptor [candidate division KSB1 bacterium]